MSKGELWKGVAISTIIAVVFGVIGGHIIYNALEMVGIFGEDLGSDPRSRLIYADSHRWVHLFAAACALAIGWFLSRRNWWMFSISLLAIFACGAYGIQNMYGFSVKNRVSVAIVKTDDKAAANRQYENARRDLQDQIKWLQGTVEEATGKEKRRLEDKVDAMRKELSALKPPVMTVDNAMADTSAAGFAKLTNTSTEFWTFALPLALAVLMFLGESFSFVVVGHMLSGIVAMFATYRATAATVEAAAAVNKAADDGNKSGSGGNTGNSNGNKDDNILTFPPPDSSTPGLRAEAASVEVTATPPVERPKSATPQRSVTPVASAPWSAGDVDAYLRQLPLMAVRPTWRQLGAMAGWNWNTLYKRGQRLTGQSKGKRVLGQHRQQHRHQEGNRAFI